MYLSYDTSSWSPKGKGKARLALADLNPNSYLQSSSKTTSDDPLTPSITSSSIVGLASLASHSSIGPTPQPRINTLPTEILTSIFILCLPTRPGIPTSAVAPLLLCHVCDYWRRLARATPFLWLDLDLGEVRPGIMRRRVVIRDDDEEEGVDGEVVVDAYMVEALGDAPGTSTTNPMATTNSISPIPDYSYPRLRTGQLKLHTLALPSITEQFASLSHPLPLRSLKLDVSRFRWDVKTDWERRTRSWVVERLVPEPVSGETRRVTIHQYRSRNVSSPSIPGEEEEGYYYELISTRDVLESALFAGGGFVAESVGKLDVSIDDLDDLPRVQVRASTSPYTTIPPFIPGNFIPTFSSTPSPSRVLTPTYTFASLHTLSLTLPRLLLSEFDFTLTGQWDPLYQQLRGIVDSVRRRWGFLSDALDSRFPENDIPIDIGGGDRPLEGYALAFCHPRIVPNLRKLEVDAPWAALVPRSYTSPSSRPRGQDSDGIPPSSGLANLVALYASLRRTHAWTGFDALSIVPYAQLTELTIVKARPVPVWLLRALLVECVALKVGRMEIVKFTPRLHPMSLGAGGIGVGGGLPFGGGNVNGNGAGMGVDEDLGMNAECYRAFGGDPVRRALSIQALGPQRDFVPGTFVYPNQEPTPVTASGTDGETLWWLPHLEELTLRFGCTPRDEEGTWVKRRREFERERWGPAAGAASVLQDQVGARGAGDSSGRMDYARNEAGETRTWRDVVVLDGERVPERAEEDAVEFALGRFEFGRECVVRVGFA